MDSAAAMAAAQLEVGNCVEVYGLESDTGKLLNGLRGIISELLPSKGRLEVRIGPDKKVSVKGENLRRVELSVAERLFVLGLGPKPPPREHEAKPSSATFSIGDRVEVFGLTSEQGKPLNGQNGSVACFFEAKGRYEIKFASGETANVKPEHLRAFSEAGPTSDYAARVDPSARSRSRSRSPARQAPTETEKNASEAAAAEPASTEPISKSTPAEASSPKEAEALAFNPGSCVEVFGLESASGKALNGQTGIVGMYHAEKGRFEVRFADKMVSLKPECLRKVTFDIGPPDAGAAPEEAGESEPDGGRAATN